MLHTLIQFQVDSFDPKSQAVYLDAAEKSSGTASGIYKTSRTLDETSRNTSVNTCLPRGTLPSPRFVSQKFHTAQDVDSPSATHMLTQWGQFLSHDNTLTPFDFGVQGCCPGGDDAHEECFPLFISANDDPFYQGHDVSCLSFTRSTAYCAENAGPRQQMNAINR